MTPKTRHNLKRVVAVCAVAPLILMVAGVMTWMAASNVLGFLAVLGVSASGVAFGFGTHWIQTRWKDNIKK